jgi:predicted HAD superfamily Cof-like phosphohydrolase
MAMSTYDRVKEFHKAMGIPHADKTIEEITRGRIALIWEEFQEVLDAAGYIIKNIDKDGKMGYPGELVLDGQFWNHDGQDNEHLLKELADLDYVVAGTAEVLSWDFNEAGKRVHESNMSKLDDNGKPVYREDGKVLKGPNYKAPDLGDLV